MLTPERPVGNVAIVGAGMSGLVAARILVKHGVQVTIFEKARGPGGRMATRRKGEASFDHGAQYFTARDDRFVREVRTWVAEGLVAPWDGRIGVASSGRLVLKPSDTIRYVGVPRMSALTRHLSRDLDIRFETRVGRVGRVEGVQNRWRIVDDRASELGVFDAVIVTTPPDQALPLLESVPSIVPQISNVVMKPCWAVLVTFTTTVPVDYDGLFIDGGPLSWAARNGSKPGRPSGESWVLHATPEWSQTNIERDKEAVQPELLDAFFAATGIPMEERAVAFAQSHRWRYALAENPLSIGYLWDASLRAGVCGDWCNSSRAEGAFLSGSRLAEHIVGR